MVVFCSSCTRSPSQVTGKVTGSVVVAGEGGVVGGTGRSAQRSAVVWYAAICVMRSAQCSALSHFAAICAFWTLSCSLASLPRREACSLVAAAASDVKSEMTWISVRTCSVAF